MENFNDQSRPPPFTYGCICSGISAPTLAAKQLGWKTSFFSEIEKFPRAVLAHHYPETPLHGDFTTIQKATYGTVDALIGGTPCQSFSVAGKRLGLDDPRGNLALEFAALAGRLDAQWLVFENVPGLLSSGKPKGEDFATFISAVTGYEYRPPATGWKNAGIAEGRADRWGIVWRILDAQYFGVAQRRRRLFVIGYRGDWRPAAAVLLEPESMRGNSPPSRKARESIAGVVADGAAGGGEQRVAPTLDGRSGRSGEHSFATSGGLVAHSLCGQPNCSHREDADTLVAHTLRSDGFDASEDGTGRGVPLLAFGGGNTSGSIDVAACLNAKSTQRQDFDTETLIAFSAKDYGNDAVQDIAPTLRAMPHDGSHQNGGGQVAIAYPILEPRSRTGVSTTDLRAGLGIGQDGDPMFTLQAGKTHGIAVSLRGRDGGATAELSGDVMPAIRASQGGGDKPHLLTPSAVRRLTPRECERLQGMPDDFTLIPKYNSRRTGEFGGNKGVADGPRYRAIGNSMAVPCIGWILHRLDHVHRALLQMEKAA